MKLQTILLLTGIAAGLMTVSCQSSTSAEAEEFFGPPPKGKAAAEAEDNAANADFYAQVNAHIDRRLSEFNEKEEAKLPIFSSKQVKDDFMELSFIKTAEQISLLSVDFAGPSDVNVNVLFDIESRTFSRTVDDETETYTFEPFTNGVPPVIPYDAHLLYAFATNFTRIAETVSIRSFEKLEKGENPGIAQLENEAIIDENGKKKDKNFVEIKPKVITEPIEYRIDNRWCKCYDVKLKSICSPAVALAVYVSNEEKTVSRLDVIFDDDSKSSYIIDWREQDGIVLPRVIRRLEDNAVYFRRDAKVILKGTRFEEGAEAAAEQNDSGEDRLIEFDASAAQYNRQDFSGEEDDDFDED